MNILFRVGTVTAIAAGAGLVLGSGSCGSTSGEPPAEILVENQRLRSENESLALENERLSTTNQDLQARLNDLRVEGAEQQGLALENERLRGELERARIDAAEEAARRDQLEEAIDEERRSRIRLEGLLDQEQSPMPADGFGWLGFSSGVLFGVLVLLSVIVARSRWSPRAWPTPPRPIPVDQGGTEAVARRAADASAVEVSRPDR